LNLTLQAPLVDADTPYFPCMPTSNNYLLGRSFLQAAFVAVNWGTGEGAGNWFLAQAPGPNVPSTPSVTAIEVTDTTVKSSQDSWEASWSSHWTPLPSSSSISSGTPSGPTSGPTSDGGLSIGAKAGIGVGCAVVALIILAAIGFLCIRSRRRRVQIGNNTSDAYTQQQDDIHEADAATSAPQEMHGQYNAPEMENPPIKPPLQKDHAHVYELGGS
jgi:hypothetical protein